MAKVRFVTNQQRPAVAQFVDQLSIFCGERRSRIQHEQGEIGVGDGPVAAFDPEAFDQILRWRMPAVSTSLTGMPSRVVVSVTRSRVVPGMSVTMARSCSSRRLKRLLLPTLGGPTMARVKPWSEPDSVAEAADEVLNLPLDGIETAQDLVRRARR